MKILVTAKRVIDPYVKIKVKADGTGVEKNQVKMAMNPFDEIALEEAIRLKEQGKATEIILVSIVNDDQVDILRHGLAMGADRAICIKINTDYCGYDAALILATIVRRECPDLVLMGKQAIDDDSNQVPQMLATLLDWGVVTYASKITLNSQGVEVVREVSSGLETVSTTLPAVISVDLRLNEPRYASLPNIMKAKAKLLESISVQELGLTLVPKEHIKNVAPPPLRSGGVEVSSVDELMQKLIIEAQVI